MLMPFEKTRELESQIDEFLDIIVRGALALKAAIRCYLVEEMDEFSTRMTRVAELEHRADDIRKHTETTLYTFSLIPESRGDVLALLENMDNVIDQSKKVLQRFEVERPIIPQSCRDGFTALVESSVQAVDNVVAAARAYFRDADSVRDHINKVDYYESEADRAGLKLKRLIFSLDVDLSLKMHLRYFAEQIESISDYAEHVAERLAISTIKRSL